MRTLLIALLLPLLATSGAIAQRADDGQLIDVRFPGGTATKYLAAIRQAAGEVNVLIAPEAAEVEMPPVTLQKVSVAAALNLLDGRERRTTDRIVRLKVNAMPVYVEAEQGTYQVRADIRLNREPVAGANVWSVSTLLSHGITSKALLSAVEMALDVVGSDTPLDVRFHEDTGLLIAMGDADQMETIDAVLDQLRGGVADDRAAADKDELADLRQEVMRLNMLNSELARMLDGCNKQLERARNREPLPDDSHR